MAGLLDRSPGQGLLAGLPDSYWNQIQNIIQQTMRLAPHGLPIDRMRPSNNVEWRETPPEPFHAYSPMATLAYMTNRPIPSGPLSRQAGFDDIIDPALEAMMRSSYGGGGR